MSKHSWILGMGLAIAGITPLACASPISLFNFSGTTVNNGGVTVSSDGQIEHANQAFGDCAVGATCTFSGTLGFNTSNGTLTSFDVEFPGLPAFNALAESRFQTPNDWHVTVKGPSEGLGVTFSTLPTAGSLVGFTGGSIIAMSGHPPDSLVLFIFDQISGGTITAVTAVPEPSAWGMFGLGLVLIGGFAVLRRRRSEAA